MDPPTFLQCGDQVGVVISDVGLLHNVVQDEVDPTV
jgi:hypothetical protein